MNVKTEFAHILCRNTNLNQSAGVPKLSVAKQEIALKITCKSLNQTQLIQKRAAQKSVFNSTHFIPK